jgi:hypothetical protein
MGVASGLSQLVCQGCLLPLMALAMMVLATSTEKDGC